MHDAKQYRSEQQGNHSKKSDLAVRHPANAKNSLTPLLGKQKRNDTFN